MHKDIPRNFLNSAGSRSSFSQKDCVNSSFALRRHHRRFSCAGGGYLCPPAIALPRGGHPCGRASRRRQPLTGARSWPCPRVAAAPTSGHLQVAAPTGGLLWASSCPLAGSLGRSYPCKGSGHGQPPLQVAWLSAIKPLSHLLFLLRQVGYRRGKGVILL
ncbi:hypothetical protein GW17_00061513, partial [Ensete ventricosum]